MRYVFVSDIHGDYDKLIVALDNVSFNKNTDTIVSLGDPFDRGEKSKEVLEFLMSCPNRILVWGNHDAKLKELVIGLDKINAYDKQNGLEETFRSFCERKIGINCGLTLLKTDARCEKVYNLLWKYFDECVWCVEFNNLIATHAWLPTTEVVLENNPKLSQMMMGNVKTKHVLKDDWRKSLTLDWYEASWSHTENMIKDYAFPDKDMIVGHWHAWRIAAAMGETRYDVKKINDDDIAINCDMCTLDNLNHKVYFIDGCTNWPYGGKVNTFVYETDAEPIIYNGKIIKTIERE